MPIPTIPEFSDVLAGYRLHTLEVQLRKYGDSRKTATHTYTTVYPVTSTRGSPLESHLVNFLAQGANDQEWHSAIDLYQVIGLRGVMQYIEDLPSMRQFLKTAVAATSAVVIPAPSKTKATTVLVKA